MKPDLSMHLLARHSTAAAFVLALSLWTPVRAADESKLTDADKTFIEKAASAGVAEVELGKLGQTKAGNAHCKSMAADIVADHTKANSELEALATKKGVKIDKEPDLLTTGGLKLLERNAGAKFDDKFMKKVTDDHKEAIELFEKAAKESQDADVKAFAANTLPVLRKHLSMAENKTGSTTEKKPNSASASP